MSKILELYEKRAKTWEAAKAFLESKRDKDGMVSAEDSATYDKMEADVMNIGKEIERLQKQAAIEEQLAQPTSNPILQKPQQIGNNTKTGTASDAYRQTFWNSIRKRNFMDVQNALEVGEDSEGGFLVPDEYEKTLIEALEEENIFRKLATVIKTASGDRKIPVVSSKGTAAWLDEEAAFTESDDVFDQITMSAYKLGTLIKVSDELLNDSAFNLEAYISKEFARRIGTKEEEAFIIGDGSGKPTGLFNATGGASDGVTAASETAITFDDILDLFHSIRAPYRKSSSWLLNDSTIKAIRKLKDGNSNYIWQPSLIPGQPDTILGRPYHTSTYVPALEAGNKVIAFGDFSYYWVADRSGRSFKRLNELYATTGQVGFLAYQRVDGRLILPEAVKVLTMKASS